MNANINTIKSCCAEGYNYISKQVVNYGKPVAIYINQKAIEHPVAALIAANVGLIYLAKFIAELSSKIFNVISCGIIPRNLRPLSTAVALSIITAGNYAIYKCIELNLSMELTLFVPMATFTFVIVLNNLMHKTKKKVSPLVKELVKQQTSPKVKKIPEIKKPQDLKEVQK